MKKVLAWILVIVWSFIIFGFSSDNGEESSGLSEKLLIKIVTVFTDIKENTKEMDEMINKYGFLIRKCGHFFIYFVLGLLVMNALYISGVNKYYLIYATLFCIIYAISDEVHQLFVDGRSGQISDVLLDSSASIFAEYIYYKLIYCGTMKKR